jgi:hypothetical protein
MEWWVRSVDTGAVRLRFWIWASAVLLITLACGGGSAGSDEPDAETAVAPADGPRADRANEEATVPLPSGVSLSCVEGEDVVHFEVRAGGEGVRDAAIDGLAEWLGGGARLETSPDGIAWVIVDGRTIAATVLEERERQWLVDGVWACLERPPGSLIDGELDCDSGGGWSAHFDFGSGDSGDPQGALRDFFEQYLDDRAGEVVPTRPQTASFVIDGREVVTARAEGSDSSGFGITFVQACNGFEPRM